MKEILDALRGGPLSRNKLAKAAGGNRARVLGAIRAAIASGALVEAGGRVSLPAPTQPAAVAPLPPAGPTTVLYEIVDPTAYLRFQIRPPDAVRAWLHERKWYFRSKTCVWNAPAFEWEDTRAFLESEGFGCRPDTLDLPRPQRRKAEEIAQAALVHGTAVPAGGLAGFDLSRFPAWAAANVAIKDKESGLYVPCVLNDIQRRAFARILDQWRRTGRVRLNVLKHRQPGISTLVQALYFWLVHEVAGIEGIVIAHRVDSAQAIFRRTKIFDLRCPERRSKKLNNLKEIEYEPPHHSALRVAVAEDGLGHGDTRQLVHNSELARWGSKADEVLTGVLISVPNAAGTMVINESTAHGVTGPFYEKYTEAEKGASEYENFFVGWLEDVTCRLESVPLDAPCWANVPVEWLEDEERLRRLGADDAQLAFRRRAIPDRCQGSPEIFREQYPATAAEAFIATGSNVFPLSIVDPELQRTTEIERTTPAPRYRLDFDYHATKEADGKETRLVADQRGQLRIWSPPAKGEVYIVTGDVGRGLNVSGDTGDPTKLDYTTFRVIPEYPDADGRYEEVACWHGRMDPDRAAFAMAWLGRYYRDALLIPEANGAYGMLLVGCLLKLHGYPRVYRRESIDRPTRSPVPQEAERSYLDYGWLTGGQIAKARMIEYLHVFVRDRLMEIHDPMAWAEMRTYIRAADGSTDAESGKHDDIVMAQAIAASFLTLHPKARPTPKPVVEPYSDQYWLDKIAARRKRERGGRPEDFT